jgi:hypothetical protein
MAALLALGSLYFVVGPSRIRPAGRRAGGCHPVLRRLDLFTGGGALRAAIAFPERRAEPSDGDGHGEAAWRAPCTEVGDRLEAAAVGAGDPTVRPGRTRDRSEREQDAVMILLMAMPPICQLDRRSYAR